MTPASLDTRLAVNALGLYFRSPHQGSSHVRSPNPGAELMLEAKAPVIPDTMRAVGFDSPGGPEVLRLEQTATPSPKQDDVLIKVAFAGVNRPDCAQRAGMYPPPPGASPLPGLEVAGEVVAIGSGVPAEMLGQRVAALTPGGGYAEFCTAPWQHCLSLPDGMDLKTAAALPETLFTVWHNVFERGMARDGERLLVHGGTSGIGTMAIMLAKAFDIEVIVTCGDEAKCQAARDLGADLAINYREQDFVEVIKEHTGGEGVNVVLDMVSGDYVPRNLQCLAEDGRHVTIAMLGGAKAELFMPMVMMKRLTLTGSTLRPRSDAFKSALADEIAANAWPLFTSGELAPVMDQTFPLGEAAAAHTRMEAGEHIGKIVLEVSGG
ncbi:alcohol dehydrogenase, zinc-containing [Erythrobacter sp. NAP1]|nr:alcohol dehydrogenase, zinc-containing [Erythrobacter sp. NAP1]